MHTMQSAHDTPAPNGPSAPVSTPTSRDATEIDAALPAHLKVVRSADLLGDHQAVAIEHNGATYRLQTTKLGKLILTK